MARACAILCACGHGGGYLLWQTLSTLHRFNGTDGAYPAAAPIQGTDSNFYGTTAFTLRAMRHFEFCP
jgi:hypothetical protein